MSAEQGEIPDEESQRSWAERIAEVADTWSALAQTRLAILREELAEKQSFFFKGAIAVTIAVGLAAGALLLLAAFLAAVLAQAFSSVALGIFTTLALYAAGAGTAAWIGWKTLSRVRPFRFPAAQEELARDWHAVRASWSHDGPPEDGETIRVEEVLARTREAVPEDLEERFRAGAE
jgi:uncharacterized membrane protein YqjE